MGPTRQGWIWACWIWAWVLPLGVLGCSGHTSQVPTWTGATLDYGQGQVHLGVRYRWVVDRDKAGIAISTPEGGTAVLRIFSCGKSMKAVQELVRERLRGRLVGNEFIDHGDKLFGMRYWRGSVNTGTLASAAVVRHGPLLISISSATFDMDDLMGAVSRVRLILPLATIPGCFPLCEPGVPCVPQAPDEG